MNINLSGIIASIVAGGGVVTTAIRDHIVLWHTKKELDDLNDPKTGIQVQLGRHKDEIMKKVDQIGKATAKVEGALSAIMEFITINNKERK